MNWMNKLEKKLGRYAVPNIYRYFVIAIIVGYVLSILASFGGVFSFLMSAMAFSPSLILKGQIWRLVTWVIIPPEGLDIFAILFLVCVLMWGSSLESLIGTFRMNVLMIGGILVSDIGFLLTYGVLYFWVGSVSIGIYTTYYLLLSLLLMIAFCMPDAQVRLWFILPIRMKWMLIFEFGYMVYALARYFMFGYKLAMGTGSQGGFLLGIICMLEYGGSIIWAMVNLGLFFLLCKPRVSRAQKQRQKQFKQQMAQAPRPGSGIARHKCAICGKTELDDPELTFRFCSKCTGNKEYCQNHLFTHTHG